MNPEQQFAQELIDFIHASPTRFHAAETVAEMLQAQGFQALDLTDPWRLSPGERYYVGQNDSALIAFAIGQGPLEREGFRLVAAHTDTPTFRLKPTPEIVTGKAYLTFNIETYSSPILNTWLDRPLSLAGRVSLRSTEPLYPETRLVRFDRPMLIIPNQSLHMNRKVNEGIELDKQKDMLPLAACVDQDMEKEGFLAGLLADALDIKAEEILDFDLFLHEYEKGCLLGLNSEFVSSTRLDNLAMVHAGLQGLLDAGANRATNLLVCYDNEEVGSRTRQGAASPFLRTVLERITLALGKDREDFFRAVQRSFLISADMGHGVHPNAVDKHDPTNRPVLNGGPMIKVAANLNFTTDSDTAAAYKALCHEAGIPVQRFVSRSDLKGGSTIGPITATQLAMRSLDVGNPALAMHSIRELCGVRDHSYIAHSFTAFYSQ
jgi:aspartyl aminopeptidase